MYEPIQIGMVKLVSITIPDELASVWQRIPNKSAWVTRELRKLGGFPVESMHVAYSPAIGMCNMLHKDGVCRTCLKELDMIEYDAITEYERRSAILDAIDMGYSDVKYWVEEE